jgi:hypothetical protein
LLLSSCISFLLWAFFLITFFLYNLSTVKSQYRPYASP